MRWAKNIISSSFNFQLLKDVKGYETAFRSVNEETQKTKWRLSTLLFEVNTSAGPAGGTSLTTS
jgi:hypothetical protein